MDGNVQWSRVKGLWSARPRWLTFEGFRKLVVDVAVSVVGIVLLFGVVQILFDRAPVMEPIAVPARVADLGYSGEVVAARLIDRAREIERQTNAGLDPTSAAAATSTQSPLVTMVVPGSGVSLAVVIETARRIAHLPARRVGGEVLVGEKDGTPQYRMAVRISSPEPDALTSVPASSIDAAVEDGARLLTGLLRPCALAALLYSERKNDESRFWRDRCFDDRSERDRDWAYNLRGMSHADAGRYDDAIKDYRAAVALTPSYSNAHVNWAIVMHRKGDMAEFRRIAAKAKEVLPATARYYVREGDTLCAKGEARPGLEAYRQAYDLDRESISSDPDVRARRCSEQRNPA